MALLMPGGAVRRLTGRLVLGREDMVQSARDAMGKDPEPLLVVSRSVA